MNERTNSGMSATPFQSGAETSSRRGFGTAVVMIAAGVALGGLDRGGEQVAAAPRASRPVAGVCETGSDASDGSAARAPIAATTHQVTIAHFAFDPESLTVAVGDSVVWTNRDDMPHTVTSNDGETFASAGLDTDDQFSFRFTEAGSYPYFCTIHPVMTGTIIVTV